MHSKQNRHDASGTVFCSADSQIRSLLDCISSVHNCYAAVLGLLFLSDADVEKITAMLLKSRTGEFDLESILFLKLRGLGEVNIIYLYLIVRILQYC